MTLDNVSRVISMIIDMSYVQHQTFLQSNDMKLADGIKNGVNEKKGYNDDCTSKSETWASP